METRFFFDYVEMAETRFWSSAGFAGAEFHGVARFDNATFDGFAAFFGYTLRKSREFGFRCFFELMPVSVRRHSKVMLTLLGRYSRALPTSPPPTSGATRN